MSISSVVLKLVVDMVVNDCETFRISAPSLLSSSLKLIVISKLLPNSSDFLLLVLSLLDFSYNSVSCIFHLVIALLLFINFLLLNLSYGITRLRQHD